MSPDSHAIHRGWLDVLDGMESDLAADRALLEREILPTNPTAWKPPQHLGPIPIELRGSASRILAELSMSAKRLNDLKLATGQQLAAVRSIPPARGERSVYLDITG